MKAGRLAIIGWISHIRRVRIASPLASITAAADEQQRIRPQRTRDVLFSVGA